MIERRQDPRTDTRFSLHNLLRVRALRHRLSLAVLGTPEGMLMAGSREDRPAQRAVAHAALALVNGGERFERLGKRTAAMVQGLRFDAGAGGTLCLAVLAQSGRVAEGLLEELASRIQAILREGHQRQAA